MLNILKKKFLIYGFGLSGQSCFNFLNNNNFIKIYDDNSDKILNKYEKFFINKNKLNYYYFDYIIVSPGINIKKCYLKNFLLKNKDKIISELDIFYTAYKNNKKITITGTNGKSTTVKLIHDFLKKAKKDVRLVGNIGKPTLNEKNISKNTIFVIEASSYQIENSKFFRSDISAILNLSPDHLERHQNYSNYVDAKFKLIKNQKNSGISIINKNEKLIFKRLKKNKILGKILKLNLNSKIYFTNKINNSYFNNLSNLNNLKFAFSIAKIFKIKTELILNVVNSFKALPYRQEVLFNSKKLRIINDSKSTSFSSSISLLSSYKNIYWILGGLAKQGDKFELPKKYFKNIKAYIYGKNNSIFQKKLKNKIEFKKFNNIKEVLNSILKDAKKNKDKKIIIFSPAAASFDQFENFEKRGSYFNSIIKQTKFINTLNV